MKKQLKINELTTDQLMVAVYKASRLLHAIQNEINLLNKEIERREAEDVKKEPTPPPQGMAKIDGDTE